MILAFCCKGNYGADVKDQRKNTFNNGADAPDSGINPNGSTIIERFNPPAGFIRTKAEDLSFASFLRTLPLKKHGSKALLYDGSIKSGENIYCAVVNMKIGDKNLQQCADAIIRLRAEYLFNNRYYEKIHFNFTNGEQADYLKFAEGYRPSIDENNVEWNRIAEKNYSYENFLNYLEMVFMYAGTYSLRQELETVKNPQEIEIGDVFIKGGFPGHAVIVVDMAIQEKSGEKMVLLAQSYMPAQEIQILICPQTEDPWYTIRSFGKLVTPEWVFDVNELRSFVNE